MPRSPIKERARGIGSQDCLALALAPWREEPLFTAEGKRPELYIEDRLDPREYGRGTLGLGRQAILGNICSDLKGHWQGGDGVASPPRELRDISSQELPALIPCREDRNLEVSLPKKQTKKKKFHFPPALSGEEPQGMEEHA